MAFLICYKRSFLNDVYLLLIKIHWRHPSLRKWSMNLSHHKVNHARPTWDPFGGATTRWCCVTCQSKHACHGVWNKSKLNSVRNKWNRYVIWREQNLTQLTVGPVDEMDSSPPVASGHVTTWTQTSAVTELFFPVCLMG